MVGLGGYITYRGVADQTRDAAHVIVRCLALLEQLRGEGECEPRRRHLLADGAQLDGEVVLGRHRAREVPHVEATLGHGLPLAARRHVLEDEEPVLVVIVLFVRVPRHSTLLPKSINERVLCQRKTYFENIGALV